MQQIRTLYRMSFPGFRLYLLGQRWGLPAVTIYEITKQGGTEMITIILNHHNKYAEVDMPAMYEELQLALWKLGLDRVPEKYTLQDLEATFRYQSPLEYFVLRLLEGEMNLLDAVSAIYTVIAPPRPIMAQVQILSSGFRSITELRQEIDRMIKSSAQFGSTCFFPVRGWLVGLDGEMEPARDGRHTRHSLRRVFPEMWRGANARQCWTERCS